MRHPTRLGRLRPPAGRDGGAHGGPGGSPQTGVGEAAYHAAIRSGLAATITVSGGGDAVTANVSIPVTSIIPGLALDPATATAVMPNDDPKGP